MKNDPYMPPRPITVADHHQVLEPWAELRRRLPRPPAVLCLDYHTDILSCHARDIPLPADGAWRDRGTVSRAIAGLRHDEHFDWALRSGTISKAVIVSLTAPATPPAHPAIEVRHAGTLPEPEVILNRPESFRKTADGLLHDSFLRPLIADIDMTRAPWILDIDCDFFLTAAATDFSDDSLFATIARQAALVTLSQETVWVRLLRLPGETITGESLAATLTDRLARLRA
ncbi:MAG: UPF0489 family protein [Lentisphaeria bacterium]|nr:UPF0489 family protein [Lentisphaeria bacterium]